MHPIRIRAAASFTAALALFVLAACGDTNSGSAAGDTASATDGAEVGTFDPSDADSGIGTADIDDNSDLGADLSDAGRGYGAPCTDDADCESSLCIVIAAGADEGICSVPCADNSDCADGSDCVLITNNGQDATRVCVPRDYCLDRDSDGYGAGPGCAGPDCDDTSDTTYVGADELCDGVDNDCDDQIDDNTIGSGQDCDTGLTGVCAVGVTTCEGGLPACQQRSTSSVELCNGLDDDCDGEIDEDADNAPTWYRDTDNDRFGDADDTIRACARPEGYVDADGDCDDTRATSSPVAIEVCDGLDNDCDDEIDEGFDDDSIASCDGDPATGCETDLSSSAEHCGACGVTCDEGVACVEGVCGCPEGQVECATTWYYQWADQGTDGYWYCVREFGSTEYGRCEDDSYDVERISGPSASCTSDHRSGECCDSYPGSVCSSACSGSLCSPTSGSCSGNCNGTSYLRNCDVP